MNEITMLRTAVALLAIGALGGVAMAIMRLFRQINPPSWLAMLHGFLAAAGLTLLLYAALTVGIPGIAQLGLGLLVITALIGVTLNLKYQWERVLLPRGLMIGHALLAIVGFLLILVAALSE